MKTREIDKEESDFRHKRRVCKSVQKCSKVCKSVQKCAKVCKSVQKCVHGREYKKKNKEKSKK